jgi:CII-binding regulator of phage lambda lysogenization HflD
MEKTHAEIRFDNARKRLSRVLKNLEEVVKEKLSQEMIEMKVFNSDQSDGQNFESKIIEQSQIIENLNSEINNLQKNLSDLGKESEFLSTKNKIFSEKIAEIRTKQSTLIEDIESDLLRIEEVIYLK